MTNLGISVNLNATEIIINIALQAVILRRCIILLLQLS